MKRKLLLGLSLSAMILTGCVVQTIQPLFSNKESIQYPPIAGTWTDDDKAVWTFTEEAGLYECAQTDEKGRTATFKVLAGRIGANVFLDFSIDDSWADNELNSFVGVHLVPVHTFAKVIKTNDGLSLILMDADWVEKYLEQNSKALAHLQIEGRPPLLTASSADLKKFVSKYADDAKVFKKEWKLVRKSIVN